MMQSRQLIIGEKYRSRLETCFDNVIWLPDNPDIDPRLSGHADLSVFSPGDSTLFAADYLRSFSFPVNTSIIESKQSEKYPNDVQLNVCTVGNKAILNLNYAAGEIVDFLESCNYELIDVAQGYSRCCTLKVSDDSIITSDESICRAASRHDLNVLKISQGYIELDGFDYGFIGGCGFLYDRCTLLLTGSIQTHPDSDRISSFCANLGIHIEEMTNGKLFDIGGIISIQ